MRINKLIRPFVGAKSPTATQPPQTAPTADYEHYQSRPAMFCHPEPIRFAQGKLREGSVAMGTEMLRYAQHDKTGFGR